MVKIRLHDTATWSLLFGILLYATHYFAFRKFNIEWPDLILWKKRDYLLYFIATIVPVLIYMYGVFLMNQSRIAVALFLICLFQYLTL